MWTKSTGLNHAAPQAFAAPTDVIKATLRHVESLHKAKTYYCLPLPRGRHMHRCSQSL